MSAHSSVSQHRPGDVVVLHAHPDDEAIFTGATIRLLADAGARVVLVTATSGEEGSSRIPLARGESIRTRRVAELERACELLGVARLVLLGYRDSGAAGGPYRRGALGAVPSGEVARRVGRVLAQEGPAAIMHYDARGIYGHVDHLQVHRAGVLAARRLGVPSYQATIDAEVLRRGPRHVLQGAAGEALDAGVRPEEITFSVQATAAALLAKMAAMAAHASQIGPEYLDFAGFERGYGREWFVRRGGEPVLERTLERTPERTLERTLLGSAAR